MLKEKDLSEMLPAVKYKDGENISVESIKGALQAAAQKADIPMDFGYEQVKGGLFSSAESYLTIFHPEHKKDYYSIAVRVNHQGKIAFVSSYFFGESKLIKSENLRKQLNSSAKEAFDNQGKSYSVLGAAASGATYVGAGIAGIKHLIKGKSDKQNLEIEQQWYSIIADILSNELA